MNNITFYKP